MAAKRLKHQRPEDVYFARKEFHILEKICGGGDTGVVRLVDYFESPSQSVIITEYLEGVYYRFSTFNRNTLYIKLINYQTKVDRNLL